MPGDSFQRRYVSSYDRGEFADGKNSPIGGWWCEESSPVKSRWKLERRIAGKKDERTRSRVITKTRDTHTIDGRFDLLHVLTKALRNTYVREAKENR